MRTGWEILGEQYMKKIMIEFKIHFKGKLSKLVKKKKTLYYIYSLTRSVEDFEPISSYEKNNKIQHGQKYTISVPIM